MAQAGYTPISLYYSTTAAAVPLAANLAQGELGINIQDEKLYFKNAAGTVKLLASNATSAPVLTFSAGTTGFTPNTATSGAITLAGTLGVASGGTGLTAGTSGGILGYTATGTLASSVALTANALVLGAGAGATPTPMASLGTTTTVLHGNASGAPTFGAVSLTADVTGVLPTANGGTNLGGATPFTSGGVVYASSSSALATGSALTFDGLNLQSSRSIATAFSGSNAATWTNGIGLYNSATPAAGVANLIHFTGNSNVSAVYGVVQGSSSYGEFVWANYAGSFSELGRWTATGLGVGVSNPTEKLVVNGNTRILGGGYLQLFNSTNASNSGFATDATGLLQFSSTSVTRWLNNTLAVEQMRLDSAGNLGLAGTPKPYLSPNYKALDMHSGRTVLMSNFATPQTNLQTNAYYDTSFQYSQTGYAASNYVQQDGAHYWYQAPSGTAGNAISFTQALTLDASGNLLVGTTTAVEKLTVAGGVKVSGQTGNADVEGVLIDYQSSAASGRFFAYNSGGSNMRFFTNASGGSVTERARIDSSGNLLVGTTSTSGSVGCILEPLGRVQGTTGIVSTACFQNWNQATSGDNLFQQFYTEGGGGTLRGSITYNRAGGLTAYNVTSDYRAKDISGPVTGSGALIDSTPVYMGKMKGATQERPMFIAHEVPAYAHTGEKDAVDADGNPVYQQMDASALIPVMWAEIQSLRQRLAAANL